MLGRKGTGSCIGEGAIRSELLPPSLHPPPSPRTAEPRPEAWEADFRPDLGVALPPRTTQRLPPAHFLTDTIHTQLGKLAQLLGPRGKGITSLLFF